LCQGFFRGPFQAVCAAWPLRIWLALLQSKGDPIIATHWNAFMPKITVTVPHHYDPQLVIAKATQAIENSARDFQASDLKIETVGNTATFGFRSLAFRITGKLEARPEDVLVEVDLPLLAMAFKDMAEEAIRDNLERAIAGK
jgi:Putative polyhydroxyalkanoic acid system protein (PHA_gran_rgn)